MARKQPRDKRGRFVKRRKASRPRRLKSKGTLGVQSLQLPEDVVSPAFRKFTKPVAPFQKRNVYAFLEVYQLAGSPLDLDPGESRVIALKIGRLTRKQLADMSGEELRARIRDFAPGASIKRLHGFGHELTRAERKGKRFEHATGVSRKARKTRNRRGRKAARKG